jgi:transcriptional regulator with XRE-family HTH domain
MRPSGPEIVKEVLPVYGLNPLRRARQARGLTLQDVAAVTKLSPRVLNRMELGDFEALPPGVLGRAHLRAYASAVGLDPDEVLRGLADRLPAAIDPVDALRARAREHFTDHHPVAAALRDRATDWRRRAGDLVRTPPAWTPRWGGHGQQVAAAIVDGLVLAASSSAMLLASAWLTARDLEAVLALALAPLLLACALMALLYYVLSRRLGGSTPGAVIADRVAHAVRQRRRTARAAGWHVWN